ncbi:hypothetical protein CC85DRAFT_330599 [Cutaneotrichosporon oleaginosum]|uniref:Eisosome component PIL1-domain-containing protein n=1 Tax=Cutaneotrichosporon oleaginosum TaxID=879819 RepID=A0A0J0XES8_9TREE|nr:uncharacterized protein CC85DRAFT_330599 [Cutaneotrichosporon oleaginosum]KLT39582.1 hypothetical protein CC85DRAFT_330599 [Cutaneotrichosporon oleaginosum]TXT15490.1 hypothetical protein COLE_01683 [Cutaneotrichosporon oleaginosum]
MTLRNASGKFSLPTFGRSKHNQHHDSAPAQSRVSSSTYNSGPPQTLTSGESEPSSPRAPESMMSGSTGGGMGLGGAGGAGGGGPSAFDGIGRKLGKSIAHTSLLPSLGNQDLRALQDVITSEKAMMVTCDRLATETGTAATKLPLYGQAEGPDLQDVLSHSSTLLNQLSAAFRAFASHEASMRVCFKKVRAREEALDEMRRRRRTTGTKAEAAERKLAKMGPENKQLPAQTDLLERLRQEMRQMDADIVHEETKLGDFKRQTVKEAMSYKFGGLEELGEKMCIIGELGKLLLEEIPLEETPPGYDRAPYNGYERTESTTKEAIKCLATVQFHAASAAPKPPGLPVMSDSGSLRAPTFGRHDSGPRPNTLHTVADHEAYGDYPAERERKASGLRESMPPQLPAIGETSYDTRSTYSEFGATRPISNVGSNTAGSNAPTPQGTVLWKGGDSPELETHDYEWQQQKEMDAARAREQAAPSAVPSSDIMTPRENARTLDEVDAGSDHGTELAHAQPAWQPLKTNSSENKRGSLQHEGPKYQLHDGPKYQLHDGPGYTLPAIGHEPFSSEFLSTGEENRDNRPGSNNSGYYSAETALPPPPGMRQSEDGEFSTPLSSPPPLNASSPPPPHLSAPSAYDGIAHPDEDTSPALAYAAKLPSASPPSKYDYSDEPAEVGERSAPVQQRPLAQYIPSVPPPAPSDLDRHDHPASVRESYTSQYPRDPRDSFAPSFMTRDSMPPGAFSVRDTYARTSNGSIGDVNEASVVNIPAQSTPFTVQVPQSAAGVMSAAAFRRAAKPRHSGVDFDTPTTPTGARRLPQPPTQAPTQVPGVPSSPSPRSSMEDRRSPAPPYDDGGLR